MTRNGLGVFVLASGVLLGGCEQLTPEMQVIHDAAEAMGGVDRIRDAENLVITGEGRRFRLGQNHRANGDLPYWEIDEFTQIFDLANRRWRIAEQRTTAYLTGNPLLQREHVLGLDGDIAYDAPEDGTPSRGGADVVAERVAEFYHHPVSLVQLALADGSTVDNLRTESGLTIVDVTSAGGDRYELHVAEETGYPDRVVSAGHHPNLGDVTITTRFENYQETGGLGGFQARLTLPRRMYTDVDALRVRDVRVRVDYDQEIGDLSAPAEARAAAAPTFEARVEVEELADGVWLLGGQSHHSVVVELDDALAVIEAPQHDARTLAVLAEARTLRPDKPVRYVVSTHHHFDHSGGVRAAVSEGATIVTHDFNRAFVEEIVARPFTREPDALARNPQPLVLETVSANDVLELGSGRQRAQLMRIVDDEHANGILMVYLPGPRLLVQVDSFSPASRAFPFAANLLKNIQDRGFRVDRIVPLHGAVVELAELERVAASAS